MKKLAVAMLAAAALLPAFADGKPAAKLEFPIVLNVDSAKAVAESASLIFPAADGLPVDLSKIGNYAADENALAQMLASAKDAKRAAKFLSMMKTPELSEEFTVLTDASNAILVFKSPGSKLRPDMNFMAFKKSGGKWLWDLAMKSPVTSMLSESARFAKASESESPASGLNAKFIPLADGQNSDNPAFAFYQKAQKEFYEMRLSEYAKFMTPKSREVFQNQFLSMPREEQEKVLEDYIQWHKSFWGIYDTGKVKVIVFKRTKACATHEMYDCAYIIETEDGLKLCNFGQNQGAFADFAVEQSKSAGF